MRIVIIGRGNVACNLHQAFTIKHIPVQMVSSREGLDCVPQADVYIYAVRDDALAQVVNQVHAAPNVLHLHTSGSIPLDVFGQDKPHAGVFYPFQTFSKQRLIEDFSIVPVFIEARGIDDLSGIYSLAQMITSRIYEANQTERERLHVAGVFASNFTNLMYGIAADLLRGTHIPFSALLPLIDETASKVHTLSPIDAQTGPARRCDESVINHHIQLLPTQPLRDLYQVLSNRIQAQYHITEN